jgi:chemotaxis protein histidine kinase CheA
MRPIQPILLEILKNTMDQVKTLNPTLRGSVRCNFPEKMYQIIGGCAFKLLDETEETPDIDVEVSPFLTYGTKVLFYTKYEGKLPTELPIFPERGENYTVNPVYLFLCQSIQQSLRGELLERQAELTPLTASFGTVDPEKDLETRQEYKSLSAEYGKFRVSTIFNPSFVSKVQVTVEIEGTIEHILEIILHTGKTYHFELEKIPMDPVEIKGLNVVKPGILAKQTAIALVNRLNKKSSFEQALQDPEHYLRKKYGENDESLTRSLVSVNHKLETTIRRIVKCMGFINDSSEKDARESLDYIKDCLDRGSVDGKAIPISPEYRARVIDAIKAGKAELNRRKEIQNLLALNSQFPNTNPDTEELLEAQRFFEAKAIQTAAEAAAKEEEEKQRAIAEAAEAAAADEEEEKQRAIAAVAEQKAAEAAEAAAAAGGGGGSAAATPAGLKKAKKKEKKKLAEELRIKEEAAKAAAEAEEEELFKKYRVTEEAAAAAKAPQPALKREATASLVSPLRSEGARASLSPLTTASHVSVSRPEMKKLQEIVIAETKRKKDLGVKYTVLEEPLCLGEQHKDMYELPDGTTQSVIGRLTEWHLCRYLTRVLEPGKECVVFNIAPNLQSQNFVVPVEGVEVEEVINPPEQSLLQGGGAGGGGGGGGGGGAEGTIHHLYEEEGIIIIYHLINLYAHIIKAIPSRVEPSVKSTSIRYYCDRILFLIKSLSKSKVISSDFYDYIYESCNDTTLMMFSDGGEFFPLLNILEGSLADLMADIIIKLKGKYKDYYNKPEIVKKMKEDLTEHMTESKRGDESNIRHRQHIGFYLYLELLKHRMELLEQACMAKAEELKATCGYTPSVFIFYPRTTLLSYVEDSPREKKNRFTDFLGKLREMNMPTVSLKNPLNTEDPFNFCKGAEPKDLLVCGFNEVVLKQLCEQKFPKIVEDKEKLTLLSSFHGLCKNFLLAENGEEALCYLACDIINSPRTKQQKGELLLSLTASIEGEIAALCLKQDYIGNVKNLLSFNTRPYRKELMVSVKEYYTHHTYKPRAIADEKNEEVQRQIQASLDLITANVDLQSAQSETLGRASTLSLGGGGGSSAEPEEKMAVLQKELLADKKYLADMKRLNIQYTLLREPLFYGTHHKRQYTFGGKTITVYERLTEWHLYRYIGRVLETGKECIVFNIAPGLSLQNFQLPTDEFEVEEVIKAPMALAGGGGSAAGGGGSAAGGKEEGIHTLYEYTGFIGAYYLFDIYSKVLELEEPAPGQVHRNRLLMHVLCKKALFIIKTLFAEGCISEHQSRIFTENFTVERLGDIVERGIYSTIVLVLERGLIVLIINVIIKIMAKYKPYTENEENFLTLLKLLNKQIEEINGNAQMTHKQKKIAIKRVFQQRILQYRAQYIEESCYEKVKEVMALKRLTYTPQVYIFCPDVSLLSDVDYPADFKEELFQNAIVHELRVRKMTLVPVKKPLSLRLALNFINGFDDKDLLVGGFNQHVLVTLCQEKYPDILRDPIKLKLLKDFHKMCNKVLLGEGRRLLDICKLINAEKRTKPNELQEVVDVIMREVPKALYTADIIDNYAGLVSFNTQPFVAEKVILIEGNMGKIELSEHVREADAQDAAAAPAGAGAAAGGVGPADAQDAAAGAAAEAAAEAAAGAQAAAPRVNAAPPGHNLNRKSRRKRKTRRSKK